MMLRHLPALQVVVPLLAAPACLLIRHPAGAWGFTLVVSLAALAVAVGLLVRVGEAGVLSYEMGGWAAPWGIEYRVDPVNAFVLLIVAGIGALVLPFAKASIEREMPRERIGLFYSAYLLCLAGSLGIAITGDAFNLFVFLEISSLSSYILISQGQDRRALTAAFQYLIMGTIGATFVVIGVGLLYMMTGTLNMVDLSERVPPVAGTRTIRAAFAFLTVGIGLKLALFPLHLWLPNAYTYAPSVATAFLAATATKVAVYVLLRFFFTVFGADFIFRTFPLDELLMALAVAGIVVASTVAIFQPNVKRLLAYSSVAQIGYMLLGISFVSATGLTGGVIHLFNHAVMKGGLFLVVGCIAYRLGSTHLDTLDGLGSQMPWTAGAFVVGGLGLVGIPLTAGFVSKWYLILAAVEQGLWHAVAVVLIGSLLAAVYVWRIVEILYMRPWPTGRAPVREAPLSMLIPTWVFMALTVYFGTDTQVTVGLARQAAVFLLGGPS